MYNMTKFLSVLICFLFTQSAFCQNFIEDNYQKYLSQENITRVQVSERMFNIASILTRDADSQDAKDAHKIVSKIKSFDLLSINDIANPNEAFKAGLAKCSNLDELIRVKDKNTNVSIRIDEDNDVIHQIVGLIASDSEFVVFTLVGEIDIKEIGSLVNKLQDEKVGKMLGTQKVSFEDVKVYPNPSKKGQSITIEVPDNLTGGKLVINDLSGKKIQEHNLTSARLEISTASMAQSTYMLKFEKGTTQINKKLILIE
jgi:hypothetical protein